MEQQFLEASGRCLTSERHLDHETTLRRFEGNGKAWSVCNMRYRVALSRNYCGYSSLENESILGEAPSGISADHVGKFPHGISHLMIQLSERLSQEVRCN